MRVQIVGALNVGMTNRAIELARLLGAPDDLVIDRDEDGSKHFIEIAAEGVTQSLEIAELRRSQRRP